MLSLSFVPTHFLLIIYLVPMLGLTMFIKVLLLCLFTVSKGAVCNVKTCSTVRCVSVTTDNCPGTIVHGGGYCGCCDACITQLGPGDRCEPGFLLGVVSTSQCADHLHCDKRTSTCRPKITRNARNFDDGPCAKRLAYVRAEQAKHVVYGLEEPHCDQVTGEFLGMQFSGSQAVCVTLNGTFIPDYMVYRWLADGMDCQCARDEFAYKQTGLVGKTYYCTDNGNYAKVGCDGSVCYCQDKAGNQIGTSTVAIGYKGALNC